MSNPIIWLVDPDTGQDVPVLYSELEDETKTQLFSKPLGGFVFPADQFMAKKLPHVPFYVADWIPKRGKSLLYAPSKAGKSTLCLQLARCIGCGERFLGKDTTKGRVLYIQWELGEEVLQQRLARTGQSYDNVYVGTTFSLKLDSEGGKRLMWSALEAVEPNVLIIDPWYKAILGDENEAKDAIKVLDFLDSIIEGFNCSVFIIHHAGKDISKRGRGSSVLEGWVDSYLKMQAINHAGETLRIKVSPIFLRHAALPPEPIEAVLSKTFEFEVVGAAPSVKEQVLAFVMNATEQVEPKQLFDAKIGSNTSVYKALKELVNEKKISKNEWGKYGRPETK